MSAFAIRCLEDYMEDVVDGFEELIRKTLIILFVAISIILVILLYIVKVLRAEQCSSRIGTSVPCGLSAIGLSPGLPMPSVDFSKPVNILSPAKSAAEQCSKIKYPDYQEREMGQGVYVDAKCSLTRAPIQVLTPAPASSFTKMRYTPGNVSKKVGRFIQLKAEEFFTWAVDIAQRYFVKKVVDLNYLTVATALGIVALSFILPDMSKVYKGPRDINELNKIIELLTEKVKNAESDFIDVADNVCHLDYQVQGAASGEDLSITKLPPICSRSSQLLLKIHKDDEEIEGGLFRRIFFPPKKSTSRKEIALMSFVYSDSFVGNQSGKDTVELPSMTAELEFATLPESQDVQQPSYHEALSTPAT